MEGDSGGDGANPVPSTAPAMEKAAGGEGSTGQGVTWIQPEGPVPSPAHIAGRWARPPQTKVEPVGLQTLPELWGVPTPRLEQQLPRHTPGGHGAALGTEVWGALH